MFGVEFARSLPYPHIFVGHLCASMYTFPNQCIWFHAVPGPCDPEDLIDGIIFAATYLGCTHLLSERTPTKSARMQQAQEAMSRVRVRANYSLVGVILVVS